MNSTDSPVLNRLILLVLCLNLVCLSLLVFRAFQKPALVAEPASAAMTEPAAPVESAHVSGIFRGPSAPVPRRVGTASAPRMIVPAARPNPITAEPTPAQEPVLAAPGTPLPPPLVNLGSTRGEGGVATVDRANNLPGLAGKVTLIGVPKPEIRIPLDPTCGKLRPGPVTTRHFVVSPDGGLANVLVWFRNGPRRSPVMEPPLLDQAGCMFEPYVLGVVVNQKLRVRNSDPVLHNVHFTPRKSHELNFAQTQADQINEVSFSRSELFVRVKCDVHPWMFAYVSVLEHPYFAITDTNGFFRIPSGFAPGHYVVAASHLKAGEQTREVDLRPGEQQSLDFELAVPDNLQARR